MRNKKIFSIICSLFLVLLVVFSKEALEAARNSFLLWWNAVLPSLFPFFVLSSLLIKTDSLSMMSKLLAPLMKRADLCPESASVIVLGILGGYPAGAALAGELQKQNKLNTMQATNLLILANLAGPMFIMGTVATAMLHQALIGPVMLACYYIAAIFCFVLATIVSKSKKTQPFKLQNYKQRTDQKNTHTIGEFLGECISNGMAQMLKIGGTMVLFSVLFTVLRSIGIIDLLVLFFEKITSYFNAPSGTVLAVLSGFFEMSMGCSHAGLLNASIAFKAGLSLFILSVGGASVLIQTLSFAKIKISRYLCFKFIQALISAVLCGFAVSKFNIPAFANLTPYTSQTPLFFSTAACLLIIFVAIHYRLKEKQ